MKSIKFYLLFAFLLCNLLLFALPRKINSEPIYKNNGSPILYNLLVPFPDTAEISIEDRFEFKSSFILENSMRYFGDHEYELYFDFETRRIPFEIRFNPIKRLQFSIGAQYFYLTGGFTDIVISKTHKLLNISGRREHTERVDYSLVFSDISIYQVHKAINGLADPVVSLKLNLLDKSDYPIKLSFKFSYKNPTDSEFSMLKSGKEDYAGSFLFDAKLDKFALYLELGKVFVGKCEELDPLEIDDYLYGYMTGEYNFSKKFRALIQLSALQNPFRNNGKSGLDEPSFEILFGAGYRLNEYTSIELGFTQDLSLTAPEFGLNAGIGVKF